MTTPIQFIREASKAVPAIKYAIGIGGIAATISLVYSFKIDPRVAVIGAIIMLLLMGVLVVFARASSLASEKFAKPALVFTWFTLLLFMAVSIFLVGSVFFKWPVDLQCWITANCSTNIGELKIDDCVSKKVQNYEKQESVLSEEQGARSGSKSLGGSIPRDRAPACHTVGVNQQIIQATPHNTCCHGGRCSKSEVTYSDGNRTACIQTEAWSEDKAFGAGGCARYKLEVVYKNIADTSVIDRFKSECILTKNASAK